MTTINITVDTSGLDAYAGQVRTRLGQVIRKVALDAQAAAQAAAPVDTGLLKASIYTVTAGSSGDSTAGERGGSLFPPYQVQGAFQAAVVVGATYGYWIEYGSASGTRPARPFLIPALAAQETNLNRALAQLLANPGGSSGRATFSAN